MLATIAWEQTERAVVWEMKSMLSDQGELMTELQSFCLAASSCFPCLRQTQNMLMGVK